MQTGKLRVGRWRGTLGEARGRVPVLGTVGTVGSRSPLKEDRTWRSPSEARRLFNVEWNEEEEETSTRLNVSMHDAHTNAPQLKQKNTKRQTTRNGESLYFSFNAANVRAGY